MEHNKRFITTMMSPDSLSNWKREIVQRERTASEGNEPTAKVSIKEKLIQLPLPTISKRCPGKDLTLEIQQLKTSKETSQSSYQEPLRQMLSTLASSQLFIRCKPMLKKMAENQQIFLLSVRHLTPWRQALSRLDKEITFPRQVSVRFPISARVSLIE